MSVGLIIMHAVLALVAWLIMLNGYLRGRLKLHVDAFLGACWLGLLIAVFVAYGWKTGLLALSLSLVYGAILSPVARVVAAKMLRS